MMKGDEKQRLTALLALMRVAGAGGAAGAQTTKKLQAALGDDQRPIRLIAAIALVRSKQTDSRLDQLLVRELKAAGDPFETMLALGGLAEMGAQIEDKETLLLVRELLMSADARIAMPASHVLINSGEAGRVALLWAAMLRDEDSAMRMCAATSLWRMGRSASRFRLQMSEAWSEEPDSELKQVMALALLAMTDDGPPDAK